MKKILVVAGIVTSMVAGLAAMASASADDWYLSMKSFNQSNSAYSAQQSYGVYKGAADAFDTNDGVGANIVGTTTYVRDYGLGDAANGYNVDLREPFTSGTKTWSDIRLGCGSSWAGSKVVMKLWQYGLDASTPVVSLKVVNDPTGKYAAGTMLIDKWDTTKAGSSSSPAYAFTWDTAEQMASFKAGNYVQLELTAAAVPEPGSMLAMLSGLVGLAGFGIRRRK